MRSARKRGSLWVRLLDVARLLTTAERRSLLWTRLVYRADVHQTTPYTCEDRYPELFDLAAALMPDAKRIWSFGCSTGEELVTLRRRFPGAEIVGSELNPRSRRIAARRTKQDRRISVVRSDAVQGTFDIVFALAVLQREPHKIAEMEIADLSPYYPFQRFDAAVRELAGALRRGGLLCVANAQYRVEDSSIVAELEPVKDSPELGEPLFGADGRRLRAAAGRTIFQKRG
jgi:SAM-dependent methyltransferase